MVFRTLIKFNAAKRVPLIKFRKGGNQSAGAAGAAPNQASSKAAPPGKGAPSNAIEDYELPPRYWRKPIDKAEMDYINNGGPL